MERQYRLAAGVAAGLIAVGSVGAPRQADARIVDIVRVRTMRA
jgi:hypothetical protein